MKQVAGNARFPLKKKNKKEWRKSKRNAKAKRLQIGTDGANVPT